MGRRRVSLLLWTLAAGAGVVCALHVTGASGKPAEPWEAPARAAKKQNPVPSDEKSVAAGKKVYKRECASCHGEEGKGNGPSAKDLEVKPQDLAGSQVAQQSDGALFWKTTKGRKPMPGFEKTLSEEERWQVVNYIRTFGPGKKPEKTEQ